jgi:hypothetical protein
MKSMKSQVGLIITGIQIPGTGLVNQERAVALSNHGSSVNFSLRFGIGWRIPGTQHPPSDPFAASDFPSSIASLYTRLSSAGIAHESSWCQIALEE